MQMVGDSLQMVPGGERFANDGIGVMLPYDSTDGIGAERILVGSGGQGLFLYDRASFQPFKTEVDAFLKTSGLSCCDILKDGKFALGTLQAVLVIIDRQGHLLQHIDTAAGLQQNFVRFILTDGQGAVWLALSKGLARIEAASPFTFYREDHAGNPFSVLFMRRHQGTLYVGGASSGVLYLHSQPLELRRVADITGYCDELLSLGDRLLVASSDGVYQIEGGQARLVRKSGKGWRRPRRLLRSRQDSSRVFCRDGRSGIFAVAERKVGR